MAAVLDNELEHTTGWRAELSLSFERDATRTILARRQHVGPLVVQRPFYPEGDVCHVYIVHPPGGIVGGDRLRLNATIGPNSHTIVTTPAATKFYRTLPDRHAALDQTLLVHDATLEWLPQETILFDESRVHTVTKVELKGQSRFIGWELVCYGRPASNELFETGYARQRFELWIDDRPMVLDRLLIEGTAKTMHAPWGLANHTFLGTLLAFPATVEDLEAARQLDGFACTLVDRVLSCRRVANDADSAKQAFLRLWQALRPRLLDREAVPPRIWST